MIRKQYFGAIFVLSWLILLISPDISTARTLVSIKVIPPNVGVLVQNKTQQFQAIAKFNDGSSADYTKKVGWSLAPFPLAEQTMKPEQVARIDRNGLLTVLSSWGRVRVVATYPPPPTFTSASIIKILLLTPDKFRSLPAILSLLLLKDNALQADSRTGSVAGGNIVVITGRDISNGTKGDIVSVKLNGVESQIVTHDQHTVVVIAGKAAAPSTGAIEVVSESRGSTSISKGYRYTPPGSIEQWASAGDFVLLTGAHIGNGSDIYNVKLFGENAEILEQSDSSVLIRNKQRRSTTGAVEVHSASQGLSEIKGVTLPPASIPFPWGRPLHGAPAPDPPAFILDYGLSESALLNRTPVASGKR